MKQSRLFSTNPYLNVVFGVFEVPLGIWFFQQAAQLSSYGPTCYDLFSRIVPCGGQAVAYRVGPSTAFSLTVLGLFSFGTFFIVFGPISVIYGSVQMRDRGVRPQDRLIGREDRLARQKYLDELEEEEFRKERARLRARQSEKKD